MTSVHREDILPIGRQVTPMGAGLFSFMTCQAANCRTKQTMVRLNKLAGWVAEVVTRNFNHLEAFSQSNQDYALRKPGGWAAEVAAHNLQQS